MNQNGRPPYNRPGANAYPGSPNRGYSQNGSAPQRRTPPRKKRIRFKPNKEGMLALLALVLIAAVVITLLVFTIKAIAGAVSSGKNPHETTSSSDTQDSTTEPVPVKTWHDGYTNTSISSSDIVNGNLILVNFKNAYSETAAITSKLTALYGAGGYGSTFVLKSSDMKIRREILSPLRTMLDDLIAANDTLGKTKDGDRVIICSAHRTIDYQTKLYNDATEDNYVAKPGYSEHHTGLAVDLKVFTSDTKTIEFRDNEQAWMEQNCAKYGFVVRYDGSKFETTGILDETWHFRYVGVPHATYMTEHNLCLEEYLELLKNTYAYPSEPLAFSVGETDYLVYYVAASGDSTTFLPVPPESVGSYEVSGNNMDGFIVTVTKK